MEENNVNQNNPMNQSGAYGDFTPSNQPDQQASFSPTFSMPRELSGTNYLVLYAISLGLLASILSTIASLLEVCFNYVGASNDTGSDWVSGYTLKFLLWLVANLIIVTPIYIFLLIKSKNYDVSGFTRTTRKIRNALYGFFMTILGLFTVWSVASVVYSLIVQFAPKDEYGTDGAWWAGTIQAILTSLVLGVTFAYKLKSGR